MSDKDLREDGNEVNWPEHREIESLWTELLRAWKEGDLVRANEASSRINQIMIDVPYTPVARYIVNKYAFSSADAQNDFFTEVRQSRENQ